MKAFSTILVIFSLFSFNLNAQSTYDKVYDIMQANCTVGCHSGSTPSGALDLSDTKSAVYARLTGATSTPTNPAAAAEGYTLIEPGHPHKSYLLKKINQGRDADNDLPDITYGNVMPPYPQPALNHEEIDIITAWIMEGAPETGNVVDTQLIADFHSGKGLAEMLRPNPPAANEGMQIHLGGIFMSPGQESEWFYKYPLNNTTDKEVTRIEVFLQGQSHHYILYRYSDPANAAQHSPGLREVSGFTDAFNSDTRMVAAWQNSNDVDLPEGTGYFWDAGAVIELNLHIRNYSLDSILKGDVYANVYWEDRKPNTVEMISDLLFYENNPLPCNPFGGTNCALPCITGTQFCIPGDGQTHTFTEDIINNQDWYVWMLSTHTHRFGKDYDIYLRDTQQPGNKGQMVYEGKYDFYYQFYTGLYDYEHPPVRYFDTTLLYLPAGSGLVQEAAYINDSTADVSFGLTTMDEMMITFINYTKTLPAVGLEKNKTARSVEFLISPNPVQNSTELSFTLQNEANVKIDLYDILGNRIDQLTDNLYSVGNHRIRLNSNEMRLSAGTYLINVNIEGSSFTKKLIQLD